MVKKKTCVFISGKGSNLVNLIKKSREYNFPITIKLVICNNKDAYGISYVKKLSLPLLIIDTKLRNYENIILRHLERYDISFICLAGFMKILSNKILDKYRNKTINIHPSLLPKFKGLNTYKRILDKKERKTGCTVHFVNEKLDSGKIITQKFFYIQKEDSEFSLKEKTQKLEIYALPEAIIKIFRNNSI